MAPLVQHYMSYAALTVHGRLMKSDKTKDYLIQYISGGLRQCIRSNVLNKLQLQNEKDTLWKKRDTLLEIIANPQLN